MNCGVLAVRKEKVAGKAARRRGRSPWAYSGPERPVSGRVRWAFSVHGLERRNMIWARWCASGLCRAARTFRSEQAVMR